MVKMTSSGIKRLSKVMVAIVSPLRQPNIKGIEGNYRADAYVVDNSNNRHYIAEKVVAVDYTRPRGVLSIENNDTVAGTFDAVVRDIVAPNGIKDILVPSWSLAGGQDDLIWHKATRQADGSYRVTIKATDHKNSTGRYRADAYLVDNSNTPFYLTEQSGRSYRNSSDCKSHY